MNQCSSRNRTFLTGVVLLLLLLLAGCSEHRRASWESRSGNGYSSYGAIRGSTYVVRRGDTLSGISRRSNVRLDALVKANGLRSPYSLAVGQTLVIPKESGKSKAANTTSASTTPPTKSSANKSSATTPKASTGTGKSTATKKKSEPVPTKKIVKPSGKTRVVGGIRWQWPTRGKVSSTFLPSNPARRGIKIGGKVGQPVYSSASGKVVYSGDGLVGYGELIIIKHNDNYLSAYGQNRKRLVKEGDSVKRGTQIAEMGEFGGKRVLHFEIRKRGKPVNPLGYLPK